MRRPNERGFTVVEMVVALGIAAVLGVVLAMQLTRARPRATFQSIGAELQSTVHAARQEALATGARVAVLVFPQWQTRNGIGRIVVVRESTDPTQSLFAAGPPTPPLTFDAYTPGTPKAAGDGAVITTLDLPRGVVVGPAEGIGATPLPFPYATVATNIDCSFCIQGGDRRGAIVFDERGRSSFPVAPVDALRPTPSGHSLTISSPDFHQGRSTFVVTTPQGLVRTIHNG